MSALVPHAPPGHSRPIGRYSPAMAVTLGGGDTLIHLSGQVATDRGGVIVGGDDARLQAEAVFARIEATLAAAGATIADVMAVTIFLADRSHFAAVSTVRDRVFRDHAPASTLVIAQMMESGCLVEINAVAVIAGGGA